MPIPKNLPRDPFTIVAPEARWLPTDGELPLENLQAPLVAKVRRAVDEWRNSNYAGASETSRTLLRWWFDTSHLSANNEVFRYYFAQREAVESIIYLQEVAAVRDKYDLSRFATANSPAKFIPADLPEDWRRFVVKMATGSGKTKVMSLLIAWSYFHKLYEEDSPMSRNVLLIAPNIIVLDRLYRDFAGLSIFHQDPVLPDNGTDGKNWRDDFQMTLHRQDDVRTKTPTGNIFLTNIHRVSVHDVNPPSADDVDTSNYFLGAKPRGSTTDSTADLGEIVRDVNELLIINDEAHHIHNKDLAWFKNIQDIHHQMLQKDLTLSLQADFTATPKHNNGKIFMQTISDYPLVEAIYQKVVKNPVIPDDASANSLHEKQTVKYAERYADYIDLGVEEWRKARKALQPTGKKAILFVMTDNTKNCDKLAQYLEHHYADLEGKVLVIHTKNNGDISQSDANEKELNKLRRLANEIDSADNPYHAVVSVLVLREGWDVRNVTTIVGLRAFAAASQILPEQTLGRGLRRMLTDTDVEERVSMIGTGAFMDFVKEIEKEGVVLERKKMNKNSAPQAPMLIFVDRDDAEKNIAALDLELPILSSRQMRDYSRLEQLNPHNFNFMPVEYLTYDPAQTREIIFRDVLTSKETHRTILSGDPVTDYSQTIGYFANTITKEFHLSGEHYDKIFEAINLFLRDLLFGQSVDLKNPNTLRNLAEIKTTKTLLYAFRTGINDLLTAQKRKPQIVGALKISDMKTFGVGYREYHKPSKSAVNYIVGDSKLELRFAQFLDACPDVVAFVKNYDAIGFRLEYTDNDNKLHYYHPDFIVKTDQGDIFIIETKGRVDINDKHKLDRLGQWCHDASQLSSKTIDCRFVEEGFFNQHHARLRTFADVVAACPKEAPSHSPSE